MCIRDRPVVEELEGGDVTITPANPRQDDTVTITPEPEEGKEVDEVTVLDQNGNALKVKDMGDGTYTFTQPTGKATISVTFRDAERSGLPFVDVETGTWYYDAVEYAYENSLMTGTSATTFSPDNIATRAQMATILWRLADSPVVNYPVSYTHLSTSCLSPYFCKHSSCRRRHPSRYSAINGTL